MGQGDPVIFEEKRTATSVIRLGSDDIIRVLYVKGSKITPASMLADQKVHMAMSKGKAFPFIFDAEEKVNYTSKARDFAHTLKPDNMLAVAVVVRNFAYRLIAEVYTRINKPPMPYKVFGNMDDAENWAKLFL
jgi:hypothetical protein